MFQIPVEDRNTQAEEEEEETFCEVCQQSDREDRMLLCDGCDLGYVKDQLGLVARKHVFGVSVKASFKLVSSATVTT